MTTNALSIRTELGKNEVQDLNHKAPVKSFDFVSILAPPVGKEGPPKAGVDSEVRPRANFFLDQ